jgi:hypothetical protein
MNIFKLWNIFNVEFKKLNIFQITFFFQNLNIFHKQTFLKSNHLSNVHFLNLTFHNKMSPKVQLRFWTHEQYES